MPVLYKNGEIYDADSHANLIKRYGLNKGNYYNGVKRCEKSGRETFRCGEYSVGVGNIEIRCEDEAGIPFMEYDERLDKGKKVVYMGSEKMEGIKARRGNRNSEHGLEWLIEKYLKSYSLLPKEEVTRLYTHNWLYNPSIGDDRAEASFIAGYMATHNGERPEWMPVRPKAAIDVFPTEDEWAVCE